MFHSGCGGAATAGNYGNAIVSVTTATVTETSSCCPCCGQSLSNHPQQVYYTASEPERKRVFVRRRWRVRVAGMMRCPRRRHVTYERFLRPQSQAPRPKCRDPPLHRNVAIAY